MLYQILLVLIFLSSSCFAQVENHLSLEESSVLNTFFRILTKESEAGYVLFNKKPVCIHGYHNKDVFTVNLPAHKQSVALREGSRIWNKINNNSDILIHIFEKEDPSIAGYIHVLVINVPLFHQVVNENLPLFQYILGPAVTSSNLLNALTSPNGTFHTLLKNDNVLVGDILGFGIENSLYISRMEKIQDRFEKDTPPFLHNTLIVQEYENEYLSFEPGFGYHSINDEFNDFQKRITISSKQLVQNNPEFIFGWVQDSKKTKKFISELEIAQDKIQKLLSSPLFLETILEKLTGEKYVYNSNQNFQFQFEKNEINKVVAKGIWESLNEYDYEYLSNFIEGFEKPELQPLHTNRMAWFPGYRRELIEGIDNLERADAFFNYLDNEKTFKSIVCKKIYYRVLKNGRGTIECNSPFLSLKYSIFSPLGHCLANLDGGHINLKNTIPGFALGIKGMKIGETREIFIHPSYAYGFDTSLEKCIHLKAIVTLLDIEDNNGIITDIPCEDLSFLKNQNTIKMRNEDYKMALLKKGAEIAIHLKKCNAIDLNLISNYLKDFYNKKVEFPITTQAEQDLINRVHWNIYYGSIE